MGRAHHVDNLQPLSRDVLVLAMRVREDLIELNDLHRRTKGMDLPLPATLTKDLKILNRLMKRIDTHDNRAKQSEKDALKEVAEFCLLTNAALRNQKTPHIPEWTF